MIVATNNAELVIAYGTVQTAARDASAFIIDADPLLAMLDELSQWTHGANSHKDHQAALQFIRERLAEFTGALITERQSVNEAAQTMIDSEDFSWDTFKPMAWRLVPMITAADRINEESPNA
jgi:hypothetical protein